MTEEFDWVERDRGILNERDREFLTGRAEGELTQNAIYVRRHDIRNRITDSILDFYLLSQYLSDDDIKTVFEPAYEWAREKRELNDQGRTRTNPDLPRFLHGWLAAFEFFSYGMHATGMSETQRLMKWLAGEGTERGARFAQVRNFQNVREVNASLDIQFGQPEHWRDYILRHHEQLQGGSDEVAEQILQLFRQRKISNDIASRWLEEYVPQL